MVVGIEVVKKSAAEFSIMDWDENGNNYKDGSNNRGGKNIGCWIFNHGLRWMVIEIKVVIEMNSQNSCSINNCGLKLMVTTCYGSINESGP